MAKPLRPYVRGGGFYPSRKYTPLVYPGGYTTRNASVWPHDPLNTFTGDIVQFHTIRSMPIKSLKVNMSPIQDLHGYNSPWPEGGGKNKFDVGIVTSSDFAISNGTFTNTKTDTRTFFQLSVQQYNNGSFVKAVAANGITGTGRRYAKISGIEAGITTLKIKHNGLSVDLVLCDYPWTGTDDLWLSFTVVSNDPTTVGGLVISDVQIEIAAAGSTEASAFSPYSNVCPISGWNGCEVWRYGKNWFNDADVVSLYSLSFSDGIYTNTRADTKTVFNFVVQAWNGSSQVAGSSLMLISTAGKYSTKINITSKPTRLIIKHNGSVVDLAIQYPFTHTGEFTISIDFLSTDPSTVGGISFKDVMIELGDTATDYEPFRGNSYSVTFEETVYGATPDIVSGEMPITHVVEIVDGSRIGNNGVLPYGGLQIYYNPSVPKAYAVTSTYEDLKSNLFTPGTSGECVVNGRFVNGYIYFNMPSTVTTIEEAQAWLVSNPTQIWYKLATPIQTTITPTPITALKGYNAVWSDAGPVEVTAYGTPIVEPDVQPLQAMNLLLGGAYRNNHTPEDVSDEEALDILLGGADR